MAAEDSGKPDHVEARRMLDLRASVGAAGVDVTWTTAAGLPRRYDENVSLADFARTLPQILDDATRLRRNLIIRPHGPEVTLLQLDDLKAEQLPAVAFLSPRPQLIGGDQMLDGSLQKANLGLQQIEIESPDRVVAQGHLLSFPPLGA